MRRPLACAGVLLAVGAATAALAQAPAAPPSPSARGFIEAPPATAEDDARILKEFDGLRVADVSDGMDMAGLQDVGLVDPAIHALWRDVDDFAHRITGIAVTVRYVPTNRRADRMEADAFRRWESDWYRNVSSEPFVPLLRPGSVVVIDAGEDNDTGSIGSNNILGWKARGAVGVVTSGGARDTDEIAKQKVPLYLRRLGRGIRPGRNEVESVNRPITLGGALVRPGDVIVADGDGVIVVPREHALAVAGFARVILEGDKKGRRELYRKLGMPEDKTVLPKPR